MPRLPRIQFPEAIYHVISRGNNRQDVFLENSDRRRFLRLLGSTAEHRNWHLLAYCLMNNHYHLSVQTLEPTLALGMRDLNSGYAEAFNRRHGRVGHVFQGRYKALVVEREGYLLNIARYIVLNPVRAGLCATPLEWPWSSHRATVGLTRPTPGLHVSFVLRHFSDDVKAARRAYASFVAEDAHKVEPPLATSKPHPLVDGGASFTAEVLALNPAAARALARRNRPALPLAEYERQATHWRDAVRMARASGQYSLAALARHFGVHDSTISRICHNDRPRRQGSLPETDTSG